MKPQLHIIRHFDALQDFTVNFTYLGSERLTGNELSVRKDEQGSKPFYTNIVTHFDRRNIIPANTLTNGESYLAKIRVKQGEEWSPWSLEVPFTTFRTPTFAFTSLVDKKYIYNNDVLMQIVYQQEQGDKVKEYQFVLMDENKLPIIKYPTRYANKTNPNVMEERIQDLVKGKVYYIGANVRTIQGIDFFDYHEFIPQFAAPSALGLVEAISQEHDGQVLVQTYLKRTLGMSTRPYMGNTLDEFKFNYAYMGGEWVIVPPDRPLKYDGLGMAKASDFKAKVWCKYIKNGTFLQFDQDNGLGVSLYFIKEDNRVLCTKQYLNDSGSGLIYRTTSNEIPNLGLKPFYLYIEVKEFRVGLKIEQFDDGSVPPRER